MTATSYEKKSLSHQHYYSSANVNIRSMFTRMRIDTNCTLDSSLRSFKHNTTEEALCKECNVHQSVSHVLLECNKSELTKNREILIDKLQLCTTLFNYVRTGETPNHS